MADLVDRESIQTGFSVAWLAEAFQIAPQTVRNRLTGCPSKGKRGRGVVYDLHEAAAYLISPKIDWQRHLKGLTKSDLPTSLQKDIWDARLKQQRFQKEAGELWLTEDIIKAFTSVFLTVKSAIQLWPDVVERQKGLTDEQREILIGMGDQLLEEMFTEIKAHVSEHSTPSSLSALEGLDEEVL